MGSCGSKQCELHRKALKESGEVPAQNKPPDYQRTLSANNWIPTRQVQNADVTFHVGREPDLWRIPAQKLFLAKANPVFHAMFQGPCAHLAESDIIVTDVDPRGFENLINYLYGERVELRSVPTAVASLHAAQKYLCTGLTELCVSYLSDQINGSNVLHVLQHALFYATLLPSCSITEPNFSPSAPPESDLNEESSESTPVTSSTATTTDQDATNWCTSLVQKCLKFVDETGSSVLASEDFEDLDRETIRLITERDTLRVVCESEVLDALCRWSQCECRRRQLDFGTANRRNVLGDLLWQVRFLAMPKEEFLIGPVASGLLTEEEQKLLTEYHRGLRRTSDLPSCVQAHLPRIATRRTNSAQSQNKELQVKKVKKFNSCKAELFSCRSRLDRANVTEKIFVCLACIFE